MIFSNQYNLKFLKGLYVFMIARRYIFISFRAPLCRVIMESDEQFQTNLVSAGKALSYRRN